MKMPDWFLRIRAGSIAMEDAECGVYNASECVTTLLGPAPRPFDPAGNEEDRRLQHKRLSTTLRDELAEDRRAREAARAAEMTPVVAIPLVVALFFIEWWASARVLIGIGGEPAASLVLGAALAAGIFALAAYCSRKPTRKLVYFLVVTVFAVLIVALTVLRMREVASDDGDVSTDISSAIVLVVLSLGPAFLGEVVLRKATDALRVRRDLAMVRRQLSVEERVIDSADTVIGRRAEAVDAWTHQSAIALAEYRRVWDVTVRRRAMEGAKKTAPAPGTSPDAPVRPPT
jgi:hypothetical protein